MLTLHSIFMLITLSCLGFFEIKFKWGKITECHKGLHVWMCVKKQAWIRVERMASRPSFNSSIFFFFWIGHVHLRKKRSVMTMHSLKVNVFRMTLKEYGSFTWVERTYPALRKRLHSHVDAPSSFPLFPLLSTYHLSRVVVLFYTLSKLFCFIVDFLTSNKVINQTKVFESVFWSSWLLAFYSLNFIPSSWH